MYSQPSDRLKSTMKLSKKIALCISLISFSLIVVILFPFIKKEFSYNISTLKATKTSLKPVDTHFSILIPKIFVNAPIEKNVDPASREIYQKALEDKVAHAKGTSLPGQKGNVYLFAHSSLLPWQNSKYGPVFYLLNKLKAGDRIYLFYNNSQYTYQVKDITIVSPDKTGFLYTQTNDYLLTLQTCYPPGFNTQRLIVIASQIR